jgi:outer membrane protein OmpA-like peptidoglycan-associated protein
LGAAPAAALEESASQAKGLGWKIAMGLVFLLLLGFTSFMIYQYRSDDSPRWSLEDIAPQTYKGFSGRSIPPEPSAAAESEEASEAPSATKPIPPVAVATSGGTPEAVSSEALPANPFARGRVIIFFPHNSNELSREAHAVLDQIALYLKSHREVKVNINGYTDSVGSPTYNLSVSQFRANSIKSYLAGKGVSTSHLIATGLGPKNPIASNDTSEGRQQNRRVEIEPAP